MEYVNNALMQYLRGFRQSATSADSVEYKIGEIFTEFRNKLQNGYMLRDALGLIDQLTFGSQAQTGELSDL